MNLRTKEKWQTIRLIQRAYNALTELLLYPPFKKRISPKSSLYAELTRARVVLLAHLELFKTFSADEGGEADKQEEAPF